MLPACRQHSHNGLAYGREATIAKPSKKIGRFAELPDEITDALSRVIEEPVQLYSIHASIEMRFDIAVSLDGESDLKRLMIQHDKVEKVIDMRFILPCDEETFVVILNDFSLKGLSGDAF